MKEKPSKGTKYEKQKKISHEIWGTGTIMDEALGESGMRRTKVEVVSGRQQGESAQRRS